MKIVVAMDSFKSSISAVCACRIVKETLNSIDPELKVVSVPMADGGEGTADAMLAACSGEWIEVQVMGPLPSMKVNAGFVFLPDTKVALVEMAKASGLELLSAEQADSPRARRVEAGPLKTTTFGTGQLIKAAADYGVEKILLAVGGSATVDGGVGAAAALGWKFLNRDGNEIGFGGGQLKSIDRIIAPDELNLPDVEVLCDVDNPLCGENGAARTFGPQKGATPEMVEQLEAGLKHLADAVRQQLGKQIDKIPGSGAAGGLSAGAIAFMNARLVSGIERIMKETGIAKEIDGADWVITGEGRFDKQSLQGKVVSGITKIAISKGVKIGVVAGRIELSEQQWRDFGITDAVSVTEDTMSLDYAIANAKSLLADAVKKFASANLR